MNTKLEVATLAGGCFWCTEAIFKRLKGVDPVTSGYSGGNMENPSYEAVSTGVTGHAETIQVTFDPSIITYDTLLDVFFATHDPTTLNRQGNDVGTDYRSVIFYHDEKQRKISEDKIQKLEKEKKFKDHIVTELVPFTKFYPAEDHHKDYYDNNRNVNPYCRVIIDPKVQKLLKSFKEEVKKEYKNP